VTALFCRVVARQSILFENQSQNVRLLSFFESVTRGPHNEYDFHYRFGHHHILKIEAMSIRPKSVTLLVLSILFTGCGDKSEDTGATTDADAETHTDTDLYAFNSRFVDGASSVSYSGQVLRQVLIVEMKAHIDGLTSRIDNGWHPAPGDVTDELLFYFDFDSDVGGEVELSAMADNALQTYFNDISSGQNLVSKIAGNDSTTDHKDWSTEFSGWPEDGVTTPESLVRHWIEQIDEAAVARSEGEPPTGSVFLSADGVDRRQLIQKFLTGAITFSQGADDYLDDDVEGKGLLSDNTGAAGEGKPYSDLEHAWDEGFGYFGANQSFGLMTPTEINAEGVQDINDDGMFDLTSEVVFGSSMNAAKRELASINQITFVADAWTGFREGRALINSADGALSGPQLEELKGHRDMALTAWEGAVAATVIHYINAMVSNTHAYGTDAYSLGGIAKHWGAAKGFALWFQFNPRSPLTSGEFSDLHSALGQTPVLPSAGTAAVDTWVVDLLNARDNLGTAFGFDPQNVGDDDGENGW
jgi:hypothetical protein